MSVAVLYRETAATERSLKIKFEKIAEANGIKILSYNINALEEAGREKFIEEFTQSVSTKKLCTTIIALYCTGQSKTGGIKR